ncbi:hypothetical protein SAMN03080602_01464 [Arenibacter troitsensis]|uniref:Uncharacterized protein n=1 Tax=Arenibacter troitsensis TaxID=188872 RepID=A0A1X7J7F0_9FLAO|nr:hypothetical protein SAMN03080602_01464 [Arenibacter troitsensis]
MNITQRHYYLYNGKQYENMQDCRESIGNGVPSKAFKHMLRLGIVEKKLINLDTSSGTNNSQRNDKAQKTT